MKTYCIHYYENGIYESVKQLDVVAKSKEDAYSRFIENHNVYAAWVNSVTYNNGNHKVFNTFCGKPY